MAGFQDLGLGEDLCATLEASGYRQPYAFQAEAIPVLLRGTTAMSVASSGSGKTLAYATALLEQVDPGAASTQACVLRPTDDQASATALLLHRLGLPRDIVVTALRRDRLDETGRAQVVVGTPAAALEAVGGSHLKLEACRSLVVDGLSDMIAWVSAPALDRLAALVPKDAQRAVFTAEFGPEVGDWVERHARRARPLGAGSGRGGVATAAGIGAATESARELATDLAVDGPGRWAERVVSAFDAARRKEVERAIVFCRDEATAHDLADALRVRGLDLATEPKAPGVVVLWGEEDADVAGAVSVSYGAPPDAGTLRRRVQGAAQALIVASPAEQPHVSAAAGYARVRLHPIQAPLPEEATRAIEQFRMRLRAAVSERDLAPYLLLLDPLFAEAGPTTVAAAAAALLRERVPEAAEPSKVPAWTKIYLAVGRKDGVRPADLVGCITGESGIAGAQIGRIDLKDTFSVAEVNAEVAERVLRSLANVQIRGRPVNARPFRGHG